MSKVILTDVRKTKKITLPSFPESEIEIFASLLVKDWKETSGLDDKQAGIESLPKYIKSWNFTDASGSDLPVNSESMQTLPVDDLVFLMKAVADFSKEEKKD